MVLGYATTAAPDTIRYGPQTYEALISEVCAAFTTTPDVAEELVTHHYPLIMGIFDYRNLVAAVDLMNQNSGDTVKAFAKQPELGKLLYRVKRAQDGLDDDD